MGISQFYTKTAPVDTELLERELKAAGVPVVGVAFNSGETWARIDFADGATQDNVDAAAAVVESHTGTDSAREVRRQAMLAAKAIADQLDLDTIAPTTLAQAAVDIVRLKKIVIYLLLKDRL